MAGPAIIKVFFYANNAPELKQGDGKMLESYGGLAGMYDLFMDNVDYQTWKRVLVDILREHKIEDGLVLDLGCGTGTMTELLDEEGYDMIGVDASFEMLEVAMEKKAETGRDILYLLQDMREFELFGTVRAIVSCCDCMNYLLEEEDLLDVFSLANNYLDPGGLFLFDMKTPYFYQQIGDKTIAENREEGSFIWENSYDPETGENEYIVTVFRQEEGDLFRRTEEVHEQRAYPLDKIRELLVEAGMELVAVYDGYSRQAPTGTSERLLFVARETYQEGKYYDSFPGQDESLMHISG